VRSKLGGEGGRRGGAGRGEVSCVYSFLLVPRVQHIFSLLLILAVYTLSPMSRLDSCFLCTRDGKEERKKTEEQDGEEGREVEDLASAYDNTICVYFVQRRRYVDSSLRVMCCACQERIQRNQNLE